MFMCPRRKGRSWNLPKKGTFVGYSENSKAFKIYVPRQHSIETYRDAIVYEDVAF